MARRHSRIRRRATDALSRHGREANPSVATSLAHFASVFAGQLTAGTCHQLSHLLKLGPRCQGAGCCGARQAIIDASNYGRSSCFGGHVSLMFGQLFGAMVDQSKLHVEMTWIIAGCAMGVDQEEA